MRLVYIDSNLSPNNLFGFKTAMNLASHQNFGKITLFSAVIARYYPETVSITLVFDKLKENFISINHFSVSNIFESYINFLDQKII